jgi:hypothetical protein
MSKPNIRIGTYTGNAAAQNISLGFIPDWVRIVNATDGTNESEWFSGMAAASAISTVTTAGPVLDATNQISSYAGDSSNAPGFSVGTDLSTNAKVYRYIAARNA